MKNFLQRRLSSEAKNNNNEKFHFSSQWTDINYTWVCEAIKPICKCCSTVVACQVKAVKFNNGLFLGKLQTAPICYKLLFSFSPSNEPVFLFFWQLLAVAILTTSCDLIYTQDIKFVNVKFMAVDCWMKNFYPLFFF